MNHLESAVWIQWFWRPPSPSPSQSNESRWSEISRLKHLNAFLPLLLPALAIKRSVILFVSSFIWQNDSLVHLLPFIRTLERIGRRPFWGQPNVLYRGSFMVVRWPGRQGDHSTVCGTKVKKERSCTYAFPIRLHGMDRGNFCLYRTPAFTWKYTLLYYYYHHHHLHLFLSHILFPTNYPLEPMAHPRTEASGLRLCNFLNCVCVCVCVCVCAQYGLFL